MISIGEDRNQQQPLRPGMLESKENWVVELNVLLVEVLVVVVVERRAASAGAAVVVMKSAARAMATNFTISSKWSLLFVKVGSKV